MLHPDMVLQKSKIAGRGLFAKRKIPKGTILWRFDSTRVYSKKQYNKFGRRYRKLLDTYAYKDKEGNLVLCMDDAKYWNHSCEPNAAPLDEKTDIAIKNIWKGEEITYDYALLLSEKEKLRCNCSTLACRKIVSGKPRNSKRSRELFRKGMQAFKNANGIRQPLLRKRIVK